MDMEGEEDQLDKDFIYVDDDEEEEGSDTSTGTGESTNDGEQKSLSSFDTCKKSESETSSFSEVQPPDLEPRRGASEHGIDDVSTLVAEAQLEDEESGVVVPPGAETFSSSGAVEMKCVTEHPLSLSEGVTEGLIRGDFLPDYYSSDIIDVADTTSETSPKKLSQASSVTLQGEEEEEVAENRNNMDAVVDPVSELEDTLTEVTYQFFDNITYLGSSTIHKPVNELELKRSIALLREQTEVEMAISLAVSDSPCGCVRLVDPESENDIAMYNIETICYWGVGDREGPDKDCFAFNIGHGKEDDALFHCHVFKSSDDANVSPFF